MSNFKKLRGRRILLSKPHKEKSGIELTAAQQAEIDADLMKKWTNLEVLFCLGLKYKFEFLIQFPNRFY